MAKEIKYSIDLLKDFEKLINDFCMFMTFNLLHAAVGLDPQCQAKVQELVKFSVESSRQLVGFFEQPLLNHEKKNREKLEKNIGNLVLFFHNYLTYAEPILLRCKRDLFNGRFLQLKTHYLEFYAKYLQ